MQQQELAKLAGVIPEQVSSWVSERKGASLPPKSRLEVIARRGRWPVEIFAEGGRRPAEALRSPLTDPGLSAPQVAEMLATYRAPAPLTADAERVRQAIAVLEMVLRELKGSLSGGPTANDDLLEFVKTAEAGHPTQPPPAARQGKSG
jgi:hypothetical protein